MQTYKSQFIEFMLRCKALSFGSFTTKSGRKTPYFIDTGCYRTGSQIKRLSEFYASAIIDRMGSGFDVLFGPAYKGIPLSAAVAMTLFERTGRDVGFCFNRKEIKDHGLFHRSVTLPLGLLDNKYQFSSQKEHRRSRTASARTFSSPRVPSPP